MATAPVSFRCRHCGQEGSATLTETVDGAVLMGVVIEKGEFHIDAGRGLGGDHALVCNRCDEIQEDPRRTELARATPTPTTIPVGPGGGVR